MNFLFSLVSCIFFLQTSGNINAIREVRYSKSFFNTNFKNRKITEEIFISYQLKSKLQCVSLCHETTNCLSVSHNSVTQTCLLFDKDFTDASTTAYAVEVGWQYFYVIKESEQRGTNCIGPSLTGVCSMYCFIYIQQTTRDHSMLAAGCESHNGGELVKIHRGLKQYCVEQLLVNENNGEVLIQGRKDELQNLWQFNDGTEMTYFYWDCKQPQNRPEEIYMGLSKNNNYHWFDLHDNAFKAAVCQQT